MFLYHHYQYARHFAWLKPAPQRDQNTKKHCGAVWGGLLQRALSPPPLRALKAARYCVLTPSGRGKGSMKIIKTRSSFDLFPAYFVLGAASNNHCLFEGSFALRPSEQDQWEPCGFLRSEMSARVYFLGYPLFLFYDK